MEYMEFKAKTKSDAITEACRHFSIPSDKLDYEVIEEGKAGLFGIGVKPAVIRARVKEEAVQEEDIFEEIQESPVKASSMPAGEVHAMETAEASVSKTEPAADIDVEAAAKKFLADVFAAMNMSVEIDAKYNEASKLLEVELGGNEMGVLIGKRGQTLDSLQYLISLVVNKGTAEYIRVKVDTENYRQRRKETLENLAKNISYKVKRSRRPVSLEPMNPYERRIIHAALQNDRYVTTHSEGEEPFRRVVITPKRDSGYDSRPNRGNKDYHGSRGYKGNREYKGNKEYNKENGTVNAEESGQ